MASTPLLDRQLQSMELITKLLDACMFLALLSLSQADSASRWGINGSEALSPLAIGPGNEENQPSAICELWVAPSTIPGAGMGLFAGRDFQMDERLLEGDLVVPLVDLEQTGTLLDDYTWNGNGLDMGHEGRWSVDAFSPGLGAMVNGMETIANVAFPLPKQDEAGLHRSRDPGAGAFTTYSNRSTWALAPIRAGQELFASYGDNYWIVRKSTLGPVPLANDFDLANNLAQEFGQLGCTERVSREVLKDIWTVSVLDTPFSDSGALHAFGHNHSLADDDDLLLNRLFMAETTLDEVHVKKSTRSREWLEQHGTCADHIRPGRSTLPQAGHGAFAKRFLRNNSVVAPLPLVHIPNRSTFHMFRFRHVAQPEEHLDHLGQQLVLNYCFGHSESSLLLCPYGPMAGFVNHNQTMANVHLRWASKESLNHHEELLQESVDVLKSHSGTRLAMELVATRDIEPGEELFLDYGDEWEEAWQNHLASWRPAVGSYHYQSAGELRLQLRQASDNLRSRLPTAFELLEKNLSEMVDLWCSSSFQNPKAWKPYDDDGRLDEFDQGGSSYKCDIVRYQRDDGYKNGQGRFLYTAIMYEEIDETNGGVHFVDRGTLVNVPGDAFGDFYDKPYSSDMHLANAFRHDIRIPDAMFPKAWKNTK